MKKARELHLLKISKGPQQEISIDIIGLLPSLNSKNTIMVIMDQFTKMIRLKVTTIAVLLKKITKIYLDKIWKIYRVP